MTNTPFEVIRGSNELTKAIKKIERNGKQYVIDLHQTAYSIIEHIDVELGKNNKDCTLCDMLYSAVESNKLQNALKNWFTAFGRVRFDKKTKTFKAVAKKVSDFETASIVSVHDFQADREVTKLNLESLFKQVLNKYNKRLEAIESAESEDIRKELEDKTDFSNVVLLNDIMELAKKHKLVA